MVRFLLFDLDRTLWDFDGNAAVTFQDMYARFGLKVLCHTDVDTFHRYYCQVNGVLWNGYRKGTVTKEELHVDRFRLPLEHFGLRHCERLAQELGDYYVQEGPKQTGLMPGTRELLEYLRNEGSWELGVVTNGFSEAQWPKMKTAGIYDYFRHFFLSEEIGFMKPDVRFFQVAQRQLQAKPEEVLVVGDDYFVDIVGARSAGMPQIYYNYLCQKLPQDAVLPTYEVRHLLEIKTILSGSHW